jgi:trehalose/maltose transport system permease protein
MNETAGGNLTIGARRRRAAVLFLAPMLLTLAFVAGWPLLRSIWFGFTDASLDAPGEARFIGFGNYLDWLSYGEGDGEWAGLLVDEQWWQAVRNTLFFTAVTVSFETVLGTIVALVLNTRFPLRGLVRAAVLIPWAIPTVVSAKMWAWMLNDQFGIINDIGLKLGLLSAPVAWVASPDTAMLAVMMVDIWKSTPFMALLILAGLQMIPGDIYEAAKIDGVKPLVTFWRITLPLAAPAILVAVIFRALDALRVFDIIYVMTPNNADTRTMSVFVQQNLFQFDQFSYGSAAATLLFLVIAFITLGYIRFARLNLD